MARRKRLDRVTVTDEHEALARLKTTEYFVFWQQLNDIDRGHARSMLKLAAADWELGCQAIWLAACFAYWAKRA